MTKHEAKLICRRFRPYLDFFWQGSDLIQTEYDPDRKIHLHSRTGYNCYDCSKLQAERAFWCSRAAEFVR